MAMILLHGIIHTTIFEADLLADPDATAAGCAPRFCSKTLANQVLSKRRLLSRMKQVLLCHPQTSEEALGITRLYATVDLEKARVGRTRMIKNTAIKPVWNETFHICCAHMVSDIIFTVKNNNPIGATLIGRAYLPVEAVLSGNEIDRWLQILDENRRPIYGGAKIHVKVQFLDVTQDPCWSRGINTAFSGVPHTCFKQREGCGVSLYQDAHIPDYYIPQIPLSAGKYYEAQRCWEDVFDAINNAKHLIYITGWSVYTEITLVRDPRRPKHGGDLTLGNLLKLKANEGVRVLMLVWDDRTSVPALKKDGLMGTHDEETAKYFENTAVNCVLCPRNPDDGRSIVQGTEISTMFTHHQKILVVDYEVPNRGSHQRRIVSFIGGIDLCNGRYDTPSHSLFRTLDTVHQDDFHQPNFTGASIKKGGPREPWHDIHCKLEGPVAWDVLYNFEQRWLKQGSNQNLLIRLKELPNIYIPPNSPLMIDDHEKWNVQLFRSIDGGAAFGFPETPEEAARVGLVSGKDNIIDKSIQNAYVHAIRRAKNFIYIENQYFLGSSFDWKSNDIKAADIGALHLIPKELSLKIISKIESGERFMVYVVIPMWPEGIPESGSVQAILDWQRRTMEMMYSDISLAIRAKGLQANPRDYLSFFCLGNREIKRIVEYIPTEQPEPDTDYSRAQQSRRFMIYVHAKMMIVDDEYIIIGSANINQRSMDGARDSEIAMGAYQPYHLAGNGTAGGQIYGFRMALWCEHLGLLDNSFLHPNSLECVNMVNKIADRNWELYSSENLYQDLPGHLLSYPIITTNEGGVNHLPGFEFFPDTKARVLGAKSDYLPPILTT